MRETVARGLKSYIDRKYIYIYTKRIRIYFMVSSFRYKGIDTFHINISFVKPTSSFPPFLSSIFTK